VPKQLKAAVTTVLGHDFPSLQALDLVPLPVLCCDTSGVIRYGNAAAARLFPSLAPGEPFADLVACENQHGPIPWSETPVARSIASGAAEREIPVRLAGRDGARFTALLTAEPLFDGQGLLAGVAAYIQPVPESSPAEDGALPPSTRLHALIDLLAAPAYAIDSDGRIVHCNRAAIDLCGFVPGPDTDRWSPFRNIYNAFGEPLSKDRGPTALILNGKPVSDHLREIIGESHDGCRVRVQPFVSVIRDRDGRAVGAVTILLEAKASHETELHTSRMSAIVNSSRDAIISKTLDGIVETWNAGATEIFGYLPSEMIGQSITRIIPPERLAEEENILRRLRNNERIDHFETERLTRDGRRIQISLTVSPIRDCLGRVVGASKIARDISERRRAEEIQRGLIKELNHRVKNTLATVQSLANQTARLASSPTEFPANLSRRIVALSQTHDLLSRNMWRGAELETIVRERVEADVPPGTGVQVSGPSVLLEPQLALHLALVLQELSTNALVHGALSKPGGTLSVYWSIDGSDRDWPRVVLHWVEKGGPEVTEPVTTGLGTTLIRRSLVAHDGDVSLVYDPAGLQCQISLPLAGASQPLDLGSVTRAGDLSAPPGPPANENAPRVLVIEDEAAIAFDLVTTLEEMGCSVVGPAATAAQAQALVRAGQFDLALLDANLAGEPVEDIAAALQARSIPFAFLSGYGRSELPSGFDSIQLVRKPFTIDQVCQVVRHLARQTDASARRNS